MSLKMIILALSFMGVTHQLLAQEGLSQKCYSAVNASDLVITTDSPKMAEKSLSAMLVYSGAEKNESKMDSQQGSDINIHAFSQNIYFTSLGIGYDESKKMYVGDCDAGSIKAQFSKEGKHLTLTSDGYRGVAIIGAVCANANLKFEQPIEFELLDNNTCKQKLSELPILPEHEIK